MSLTQPLDGQIALVTGASRGIGNAIAQQLKAQGATVIGTATSAAGAEKIAAELGEGCGVVLNLTQPETMPDTVSTINKTFGAPTILINNAGMTRDNLAMRLSDEDWDDVIQANLSGTFRLTKACLRGMLKARGGRIISIASVVGSTGNPGQTNYAAAKAGLVGFSKSLAREIGSRNVTVNVISPGFIDTDMTRELNTEQRDSLTSQIPLGRLGQADDIAAAVSFLASPAASYITGENLHVNGGMYMA